MGERLPLSSPSLLAKDVLVRVRYAGLALIGLCMLSGGLVGMFANWSVAGMIAACSWAW